MFPFTGFTRKRKDRQWEEREREKKFSSFSFMTFLVAYSIPGHEWISFLFFCFWNSFVLFISWRLQSFVISMCMFCFPHSQVLIIMIMNDDDDGKSRLKIVIESESERELGTRRTHKKRRGREGERTLVHTRLSFSPEGLYLSLSTWGRGGLSWVYFPPQKYIYIYGSYIVLYYCILLFPTVMMRHECTHSLLLTVAT